MVQDNDNEKEYLPPFRVRHVEPSNLYGPLEWLLIALVLILVGAIALGALS